MTTHLLIIILISVPVLKMLRWLLPVSYTHLDVYKRQIEVWYTNDIPFRGTPQANVGVPDGLVPVSYTHLDVYKRQTVRCHQTSKTHIQSDIQT